MNSINSNGKTTTNAAVVLRSLAFPGAAARLVGEPLSAQWEWGGHGTLLGKPGGCSRRLLLLWKQGSGRIRRPLRKRGSGRGGAWAELGSGKLQMPREQSTRGTGGHPVWGRGPSSLSERRWEENWRGGTLPWLLCPPWPACPWLLIPKGSCSFLCDSAPPPLSCLPSSTRCAWQGSFGWRSPRNCAFCTGVSNSVKGEGWRPAARHRRGARWAGRGCPEAEGAGGGAGAGAVSHCPSALDFFGADFISGEAMGRLLAGLVPELSLLVSCSHLTWVAGP